jgi:hypothetical protein
MGGRGCRGSADVRVSSGNNRTQRITHGSYNHGIHKLKARDQLGISGDMGGSTEEGGGRRERGSGGSLGWQGRRDVSEDMATIYLATKRPVNMAIRHALWTAPKGRASRDAGERRRGGAEARVSQRLERAKDGRNATRTRECRARGEGWLNRRGGGDSSRMNGGAGQGWVGRTGAESQWRRKPGGGGRGYCREILATETRRARRGAAGLGIGL